MNLLKRLIKYSQRRLYKWEVQAVPRLNGGGLKNNGYHSQYGQDKLVAEILLPKLRNGIFVDIGAHDGVNLSNTLYFEENLGWTGIAIEPNPMVFDRLKQNRHCTTINAGITDVTCQKKFRAVTGYAEMLSGLVIEQDDRYKERINNEVSEHGGSVSEIEVDCWNFNELMKNYGITKIDYLSIDVEGGELSIISSIDWDAVPISVVSVENTYKEGKIMRLMKKHGYRLVYFAGDEFYMKYSG